MTGDRRRRVLASLAAVVALPAAAFAQSVDGRGGRFSDDLIAHLEGRWRIHRAIRGTTVENVAAATWVLGHQFLELAFKDVADPPRYEAIVLIGYIAATDEYVAYWTDTFGARYAGVGRGKRAGSSIEFAFDYPDGRFFNTFRRDDEADRWEFRMENQESDGTRSLFAIDSLERVR